MPKSLARFRLIRLTCLLLLALILMGSVALGVAHSMFFAALGMVLLIWVRYVDRRDLYGRCEQCGYNLHNLKSPNCPECGRRCGREFGLPNWLIRYRLRWVRNAALLAVAGVLSSSAAAVLNYKGYPTVVMAGRPPNQYWWAGTYWYTDGFDPLFTGLGTYVPPSLLLVFLAFSAVALSRTQIYTTSRRALLIFGLAWAIAVSALTIPMCRAFTTID